MFLTLRCDLQRYCKFFGYCSKCNLLQKFAILCLSPGFWAIAHYRFGFWINDFFGAGNKNPIKLLLKITYFALKQFVVYFCKIDILITADIGAGLFLSNKGNIILGLQRMGENCTVHHNVLQDRVQKVKPRYLGRMFGLVMTLLCTVLLGLVIML